MIKYAMSISGPNNGNKPRQASPSTVSSEKPETGFSATRKIEKQNSNRPFEIQLQNTHTGRPSLGARIKHRLIKLFTWPFTWLTTEPSRFSIPFHEAENWMERLYTGTRSSCKVMDCTMVGSHDSASSNLNRPWLFKPLGIAQSVDVGKQLEAGARYLDIRVCMNSKGEYIVHHGIVKGSSADTEVIEPLGKFLEEHQKEAVVVKLQFSGLSKQQAKTFLVDHFHQKLGSRSHSTHKNGRAINPGDISFADIQASGKNLLVTVSNQDLPDGFSQEELNGYAWVHQQNVVESWANTPVAEEMLSHNEARLSEFLEHEDEQRGKIHILQMQTNVKPIRLFSGGLRNLKSQARSVSKVIPETLRHWHNDKQFRPNILLQDYVGHHNYDQVFLSCLALNTLGMTNKQLEETFPEIHQDIRTMRASMEL
ncbi:hypothetical protein EOPP23_03160 [Endozoicomonas sp. OPT23]|uniref:phosphatidylinositol-specific phospholipase C domain-containing protein n=1 Tax=Endozoicomonas sp. OPT23 TaxID=2072845 RepID=UPI00129B2449|nr:phosphatidylinositol-specific phospholipase C domain-containing protein [Endozoicomonas sp. OPT23]MRI31997.1 hypothetical protein [Endozoicomonas sp. OPT23]